jgi:hypothetical protein
MGRLRQRLFGWGCLALVVTNVAAVMCGGIPGSTTRMPCCITLENDHSMPILEPCCAAEQRPQADPAGRATNSAAAQPAADASSLLGLVVPRPTAALLKHHPQPNPVGSPPDPQLLFSVFLI